MNLSRALPLALSLAVAACNPAHSAAPTNAPRVEGEVLATVNGVPVTRDEVQGAAHGSLSHGGGAPERNDDALARIIDDELLAQRAVATGLDRDPAFREELRVAEARFRVWRRTQLAALIERRAGDADAGVSDADARRWYEANTARARSEVRVAQILVRDEAAAAQNLRDLRGGASFDDVARRLLPPIADPAERPWVIGPLRWHQLPDAWRAPLDALRVGETSDVIRGPNRRFWILKLLERRENTELTFESTRATIAQVLRDERAAAERARLHDTLRRDARIVYSAPSAR